MKLIYVHINDNESPPSYMYTSVYQVCTLSSIPIVILTNENHKRVVTERLQLIFKPYNNDIQVISTITRDRNYTTNTFRNNFWRHTTERFFCDT